MATDKHVLAIDTSGLRCSVALSAPDGWQCLHSEADRRHAAELLPMIDQLLTQHEMELADLHALAVVTGPGSFTGLRIGCAAAQGLAFGADLPVIPVSALRALALREMTQGTPRMQAVQVALAAREQEFYLGSFDCRVALPVTLAEACVPAAALLPPCSDALPMNKWAAVGDGWRDDSALQKAQAVGLRIGSTSSTLDALDVLRLAMLQLAAGEAVSAEALQPSYLKEELEYRRVGQ